MDVLILYSEYSNSCKEFIELLDSDTVIDSNKLNKMCVDNPDIRHTLLEQNQVIFKKVPCVLVKNPNHSIDVFEGEDAFEWLEDFSEKLYQQLLKQQEEQEMREKLMREKEIQLKIEQEARLLSEKKNQPEEQPKLASSTNVKQQAKIIAQTRTDDIQFNDSVEKINNGDSHVSQVKSDSGGTSVSDLVKRMEKERELEEREIKKALQGMQ